jgi:hypothetical protein
VVVDVEHRRAFVVSRGRDQSLADLALELRATIGVSEQPTQEPPHAACARYALGAQQRRPRRRRQSPHALDAELPDREHADDCVEGDAKCVVIVGAPRERAIRFLV